MRDHDQDRASQDVMDSPEVDEVRPVRPAAAVVPGPEPHTRAEWITKFSVIPGALMIVPLFMGALMNTFFPQALELGSFTTALFKNGTGALLGLFFFCMGAQLDVRTTGPTLQKGLAILIGKVGVGVAIGLGVAFLLPSGVLLGLTPLAIIAAMTNSNSTLFVALLKQFGNTTDRGSVSVIAVNDGPFITMLALGAAGLASFPIADLIGAILPIFLGFILGNLSQVARKFLSQGELLLIPFLGFVVGRSIDFKTFGQAGIQGVILGLATIFLSGIAAMVCLWLWHVIRRHPRPVRNLVAGMAEGTTAGNAIATPAALALLDPTYKAIESIATAQVAAATVTTALVVPFIVGWVARWQHRRGVSPAAEEEFYESRGQSARPATA